MYKLTNKYYISFFNLVQKKLIIQLKLFMKSKQELRAQNKIARKNPLLRLLDKNIFEKLINLNVYNSSQNVMIFFPLENEVNLLELRNDKAKCFSMPCIKNGEIIPYLDNGCYQEGCFCVNEPCNSEVQDVKQIDLVIAPALAVDLKGNRVGYGKGYYDRFIRTLDRNKTKVATVIYDDFLVDEIKCDEFDEKVDIVITDKRVIFI